MIHDPIREHDDRTFIEWHRDFVTSLENQAKHFIARSKVAGTDSRDLISRAKLLANCVATARRG